MLPLRQLIFGKRSTPAPQPLAPFEIEIDGRIVRIQMKRHATARRMVLRLARDGVNFTLTVPKRQSIVSAKTFVETSRVWMQNTMAQRGRTETAASNTIPLRGVTYCMVPTGKIRGQVVCDEDLTLLHVPGGDQHQKRRLTDWLKQQAEIDLRTASHFYADKMQCSFVKLTVRDQKSRWGSCTTDRCLSYSWRLILAPAFVLDYVAAHEVAHLKEMNHGPRFWRLVLTHCPRTREAKQWLKIHGHTLHHALA